MAMPKDELKTKVAREAVKFVKPGMCLGLGSGSTAEKFIQELAKEKDLVESLACVATSIPTEMMARGFGFTLVPFNKIGHIDLAVDGADRVSADGIILKGWGGALTREKIVDYTAEELLIIIDESKFVKDNIIHERVPIEVKCFFGNDRNSRIFRCLSELRIAKENILPRIDLDAHGYLKDKAESGKLFITDNGWYIIDVVIRLEGIGSAMEWERKLNPPQLPDALSNGIFIRDATVLIGCENEIVMLNLGSII